MREQVESTITMFCFFQRHCRFIGSVAICAVSKHTASLSENKADCTTSCGHSEWIVAGIQLAPSSTSVPCQESGSLFCQSPSLREIRAGRLGGRLRRETGIEERESEERSTSGARQPSADFSGVISPVSQSRRHHPRRTCAHRHTKRNQH